MTFRCKCFLAALGLLAAGCSSSEKGISFSMGVVHHATADSQGNIDAKAADEPRVFTNNLGYQITLSSAYLVFSKMELGACETARLTPKWLRWFSPIGTAQAHTAGSATELGVPSVENLMAQDLELRDLGTLEPPAGTYCHVEATLSPADDDAQYLPSDVNMDGKTLSLSGQYVPSGGGSAQAFTVQSSGEVSKELGFHIGDSHEAELTLNAENPEYTFVVRVKYDKLFENVDFSGMSSADIAAQVLTNAANSLHQYTGTYTQP